MRVKRLSQIVDGTDIHELQPCIYPGGHCPLFGVHMTLGNISGVTMLIIGTADCGFYTYKTMNNFSGTRRHKAQIRCAVLEESDVINGCEKDLTKILIRLDRDPDTRLIVVVTSCVIELTGEDISGIVNSLTCSTPISVVKTENFKTADYLEGVEQALTSVTYLLKPLPTIPKSFCMLGPRLRSGMGNRIIQRLIKDKFTLVAELPYNADIETINRLPEVSFTLVTDKTALGLGRRLYREFGIPLVDLSPSPFWQDIQIAHEELSRITGYSYDKDLQAAEKRIETLRLQLEPLCKEKRFIIGNSSGSPFATACLITEIGGEIELILARNIYERDREFKDKLLERGQNPLVAKNANLAALKFLSSQFNADFHLGMGWGIKQCSPRLVAMTDLIPRIGSDYREKFYENLLEQLKKENLS